MVILIPQLQSAHWISLDYFLYNFPTFYFLIKILKALLQ